jgi:hypothetical protein
LAIRVPRLSYEDLRGIADRFLAERHPAGTIPIPIEELVEFGLGINIVPLPGLHADHGIDGFLSADMTEISVDLYVFESRPARYRFTLAHEAAHLVLHGDALKEVAPATIPDWKRFVRELPEGDREWLEYQAYAFAGLVLAPREPLLREYRVALRRADEAGINLDQFPDVAKQYIATSVAKVFEVSAAVIEKRLVKDGVWSSGPGTGR